MRETQSWKVFTFASIILWAIYPILAWETVKSSPPFFSIFLTLIFGSICILPIVIWTKKWHELKNIQAWKYGFIAGILLNIFLYGFYYWGLKFTSANNAGLIAQVEVVFSLLFFQLWKKEKLSRDQILGTILIILGAVYLMLPSTEGWNIGDIFVGIGMLFGPIGNYFQKKGRALISTPSYLFIRYVSTIPIVLLVSFSFRELGSLTLSPSILWQTLFMSILVFVVLNIFWIESIKSQTVTRILALYGLVPFFTMLIFWSWQGTAPTIAQLITGIPMFLGVYLLTK